METRTRALSQRMLKKLTPALKLLREQYTDWNTEPAGGLMRDILNLNSYQIMAITKLRILQDNIPEVEKASRGSRHRLGTSYKWNSIDYPEINSKLIELIHSTGRKFQREYLEKHLLVKKQSIKLVEKTSKSEAYEVNFNKTTSPVDSTESEQVSTKTLGLPIDFALLLKNIVCIDEFNLKVEVESGERGMNKSSFNFTVDRGLLVKVHQKGLEIQRLDTRVTLTTISCLTFKKLSVSREKNTMVLKIN